jgi:hypothetical protein
MPLFLNEHPKSPLEEQPPYLHMIKTVKLTTWLE